MASGKVRGITIELEADASGIISGLKTANSAISKTQKELRDINKLLKLDPGNMTLLKQRTEALQKQVANTTKKLEQLKDAEKQMKSEGVDENSEQFRALQREIIATEQELKKLEGTAGSGSASLKKISDTATKIGGAMESAGKKLLPLSAGIVGIGTASVKAFTEVDAGYDEMIKKTGATGEAAEELREIMYNLASEIPTDFETAGAAVGEVSTRFGVTGGALEQLTEKFLKFADLNGTDVSNSVDKVQKALANFGLGAEDAGGFLDRLNKVGQDTGISVDKLSEALVTNGGAFQELGIGIDEATEFIGQLETSGANTNTVLSGMRKALKNAAKEGIPLKDALSNLQDEMLNGTDSMDGLNRAYEVFGKSGDIIYEAVKNGTVNFKNLGEAANSAAGNIERTFEETMDPVDKFKVSLNNLKIAGAEMGSTILDMAAPAIKKLSEFIKNLSAKWRGLDDGTKKTIVKFAGIAAAIAPALIALGKFSKAIGAITKVMSTLKFAKFISSPATIAITAIAGLAAGLGILFDKIAENNSKLKDFKDEVKDYKTQNDELARSIENTATQTTDAVTQTEAEAKAAGELASSLDELIQKEDKTAEDKALIESLVGKLNDIYPELNAQYDKEKDTLNLANGELEKYIQLKAQQAKVNAYTDAWTDSMTEAAKAEKAVNDQQNTLNEMMEQAPQSVQDAVKAYQQYGEAYVRTSTKFSAAYLTKDYELLVKQVDNVTEAQKNLAEANENTAYFENKTAEATEDYTAAQAELNKVMDAANYDKARKALQDAFGLDYGPIEKSIKRAEEMGVEITDEFVSSLADGKHDVETVVKEINGLVSFESAKKNIDKNNAAEAYAKEMAAQKKVVKSAVNQVTAEVDFAPAEKKGTTSGKQTDTNMANGMINNKGLVKNASGAVCKQVDMSPALLTGTKSGKQTDVNMANSMVNNKGLVGDASGKVSAQVDFAPAEAKGTNSGKQTDANMANSMINNAGVVGSASATVAGKVDFSAAEKTAGTSGGNTSSAFGGGITDFAYKAVNAAASVVSQTITKLGSDTGYTEGKNMVEGYASGISDFVWKAVNAAANAVTSVLNKVKEVQNSGSPSKVAMGLGNDFGEGYAIGIAQMTKDAAKSAAGLVSGVTGAMDTTITTPRAVLSRPLYGTPGATGNVVTNNYTQNNYSPDALSTAAIYRQTKNLVAGKGYSYVKTV